MERKYSKFAQKHSICWHCAALLETNQCEVWLSGELTKRSYWFSSSDKDRLVSGEARQGYLAETLEPLH